MVEELNFLGERSLQQFFEELVWRHFFEDIHLEEASVAHYVSGLLSDFSRIERLFGIRDASGRRLEEIGEMLIQSNPLLEASSFDRERAVRKHVGDYTLFMTGLFPENVARTHNAKVSRLDTLVDFIEAGKESYAIVSSFQQFEYRDEAPLFRRLSENFELCVAGLNMVKRDMETLELDDDDEL